jgi:hypothetical protein
MKQKLTLWLLAILLVGFVFPMRSTAVGTEKPQALPIPKANILAPVSTEQNKSTIFCIIQNDDGTPVSFGAGFDSGMGLVTYIDPAQCAGYPIYPFQITDVHLYLYHESSNYIWPVSILVKIKNALSANKCLGPDTLSTLYSQQFTIPEDSSYFTIGRPMNLTLNPSYCVFQPFFLEVDYLTSTVAATDSLPAFLMDVSVASADSCTNWGYGGYNTYLTWPDFWVGSPPGDVIIRASGYTHATECDTGWYWKADRVNAPSGMPDFNQNQDEWVAYCGPVAAANCLWWYGAVPVGWSPPQLIDTLARYFHTNPSWGTYVDTMQMGLDQYFEDYGLSYQTYLYAMPYFHEMEESLKVSQDVILLLGAWEQVEVDSFIRVGGHFVTMAGVNSDLLKVAVSDPDRNHAEDGYPGRVRPPHAAHPSDPLLHNDPTYVSQDIYTSTETSPSPGNPHWGLTDYLTVTGLSPAFEGKNFHPSQLKYYFPNREGKGPEFIEVDYTLMICPKPSAVEGEEVPNVPHDFELYQNYPNPFNPTTTIHFTVHRPSSAVHSPYPTTLKIYNVLGQKVKTLVDEPESAGSYEVIWDGKDERGNNLASGIYFYRLQIGDQTQTKRMLLLK